MILLHILKTANVMQHYEFKLVQSDNKEEKNQLRSAESFTQYYHGCIINTASVIHF